MISSSDGCGVPCAGSASCAAALRRANAQSVNSDSTIRRAATAASDAEEIPTVSLKPEKKAWEKKATHPGATTRGPGDKRRGGKDGGGSDAGRPKLQGRAAEEGFTRLFVGTGRKGGIRPQDLVGAICGETDLQGRQIGAIEITDNFSLVEVPSGSADQVIKALGNTTIKGRKTSVRRERF